MKSPTLSLFALAATLALGTTGAGCALPSLQALPTESAPETASPVERAPSPAWTREEVPSPRLYARDGSVVTKQPAGTVETSPDPGQSIAPESGSRWTLLEQYQSAVERNEELELELRAMSRALEQAEAREDELALELEAVRGQTAELEERLETLGNQNVELASRLTTAQIRRLQSEKLLLEAKLDWRRVEAMINAPEAQEATHSGQPLGATPTRQTEASAGTFQEQRP